MYANVDTYNGSDGVEKEKKTSVIFTAAFQRREDDSR